MVRCSSAVAMGKTPCSSVIFLFLKDVVPSSTTPVRVVRTANSIRDYILIVCIIPIAITFLFHASFRLRLIQSRDNPHPYHHSDREYTLLARVIPIHR
jgi:hypothetical protein